MKKISKFSIDELSNIRISQEYKDLSDKLVNLSDQLSLSHIKIVSLQALFNLYNLNLADLLGYAEQSDFDEFYKQTEQVVDYITSYRDTTDCDPDDGLALSKIIGLIHLRSLNDNDNDKGVN